MSPHAFPHVFWQQDLKSNCHTTPARNCRLLLVHRFEILMPFDQILKIKKREAYASQFLGAFGFQWNIERDGSIDLKTLEKTI